MRDTTVFFFFFLGVVRGGKQVQFQLELLEKYLQTFVYSCVAVVVVPLGGGVVGWLLRRRHRH